MLTGTCLGIVQPWWSCQILLKSGLRGCWLARTETSQQKPAVDREDRELPGTPGTEGAEFRKI